MINLALYHFFTRMIFGVLFQGMFTVSSICYLSIGLGVLAVHNLSCYHVFLFLKKKVMHF